MSASCFAREPEVDCSGCYLPQHQQLFQAICQVYSAHIKSTQSSVAKWTRLAGLNEFCLSILMLIVQFVCLIIYRPDNTLVQGQGSPRRVQPARDSALLYCRGEGGAVWQRYCRLLQEGPSLLNDSGPRVSITAL